MRDFGNRIHLVRRFPELARSETFNEWLVENPSNRWHETAPNSSGELDVVVQSDDGLSVFAARLVRTENKNNEEVNWVHRISSERAFGPSEIQISKAQAMASVTESISTRQDEIIAIRPVIQFQEQSQELGWELETINAGSVKAYSVFSNKDIVSSDVRTFEPPESEDLSVHSMIPRNDWLSSNECHHLNQWRETAEQMTKGANTTADKAKRIWGVVRRKMKYDANIRHIEEFTHSDNLTIAHYGWAGICDEWAVVQITLLRALGIPANLKFLIWNDGSGNVGHACVEWKDSNRWCHMDALWNAFDNRSVYREEGARNVSVMNASYPRDSRSKVPAWGVPDIPGDQKFYPYGDFVISPSYPGNSRPGYST